MKSLKKGTMPKGFPTGRLSEYGWETMKVGDSIHIFGSPKRAQHRILNAAKLWAKKHNPDMRFTSRQETDGARIWRTK